MQQDIRGNREEGAGKREERDDETDTNSPVFRSEYFGDNLNNRIMLRKGNPFPNHFQVFVRNLNWV
jgi:hypothetical protein